MMEYIDKKRSIADSLATSLYLISSEDLIGHILSGLDSSYRPFITTYMIKGDTTGIDDLVGFLLQEETRFETELLRQSVVHPPSSSPNSSTPLALNVHRPFSRSFSSPSSQTTTPGPRPRDNRCRRVQCQLCSKPGHEAIDC